MTNIREGRQYDCIIVGQGLAGSLLAYELLTYTDNILVIDDDHKSSSSTMAAGLINPVTGMRLVKTNNVEILLPIALDLYQNLEKILNLPLLHQSKMIRVLQNDKELTQLNKRLQDPLYTEWLGEYFGPLSQKSLNDTLGSFEQLQTAWLDAPTLLTGIRNFLNSLQNTQDLEKKSFSQRYVESTITDTQINVTHSGITTLQLDMKNKQQCISTKNLILCRGYKEKDSHYFDWLPFQVAKGEILTLRANKALPPTLINSGQWVVPIDEFTIKTGASWERDIIDSEITPKARIQLMKKLDSIYKIPNLEFEVIDQQAGVRPCTKQRQPLIGSHPATQSVKIFNGFGSKGSLLIPYYAREFARQLCYPSEAPTPLLKACDIAQFSNAY